MADELNPPVDPVEPATPTSAEPADPPAEPIADATPDPAELERLRAALAKANKEAEKNRLRLKEVDDAKLSEIEKAQRDAAEASQELASLRRDSLRQKVALDAGLPAKWVARLHGDDEGSLRADALEILADLNKPRIPAPDASQGARTSALSADDQLYESIYGKRKA
ncbi:hypothetical protein NIBR502772_06070 [Pseudarthrobacter sp. NIBRBAC000502772]|uniref:hypothetical protein n=1 Tax=Pseudarthrobacter sp. NIBRBAC000502772 TaxID=2590775 RepID=UPI001130B849|nr:hypothetical protein [Pseudarthrobacter sp. NIBRBAC000502772]QDG65838.1 hypothetical protein NIBR502772_06070 [Pseudarthrobacter sp. NIBRBAC000502772]